MSSILRLLLLPLGAYALGSLKFPRRMSAFVEATGRASVSEPLLTEPVRDVIYHLHIPKCAGTSFSLEAQKILSHRGMRVTAREGCLAWQDTQPRVKGAAVFLRDPRGHVVSQYDFCRQSAWYAHMIRPKGAPELPDSFDEWVQDWVEFQEKGWRGDFTANQEFVTNDPGEKYLRTWRIGTWSNPPYSPEPQVLDVNQWPELDGGGTIWHVAKVPFRCYSPINMQSQRLTCRRPLNYSEPVDAEQAILQMRKVWFIGIVEAYQESVCLFHGKLGNRLPKFCNCKNLAAWKTFNGQEENRQEHHTKIKSVPRAVIDKIDQLTRADRRLYAAALERFIGDIREVEKLHGTNILCNETKLAIAA